MLHWRSFAPVTPSICLFLLLCAASEGRAASDPVAALEALRGSDLDPSAAVRVSGLTVNMGLGELRIEEGVLVPAVAGEGALAGSVREMVFTGRAEFRLDPPDEIEAGQLDLFTGERRLDELVTRAVLVIGSDQATHALFDRPRANDLDGETETLSRELFERWRSSPERRTLQVEESMLLDAVNEPGFEGFFAGWFEGEEIGEFLYLVAPDEPEQVSLGQFVPLEAQGKERRKLERQLHRQQRRGRLIGMRLEDLGEWNTWVSASRGGRGGTAPFEPRHYELDLTLEGHELELSGSVRITLEAVGQGRRSVVFTQSSDLQVVAARDGVGRDLFLVTSAGVATVLLPEPLAQGETAVVELELSGSPMEKVDTKSFVLRDTVAWYPHTGTLDRATYDATIRWPDRLDLVAAGRRLEQGEKGALRWGRWTEDRPTFGFSFEVGRFKEYSGRAGDVEVTFYVDHLSAPVISPFRDSLLETIGESLEYYGEIFGPYQLDHLTVVTSPRAFSQSLLGYITLSSAMVGDLGWLSSLFESRTTVVAHEVAHQWWGHVVGWRGYRDQWISEAMANYSALLFARNRMENRPWRGPTDGWRWALLATTDDGRPIESVGPVVLGERLVSSRADGAYEAIVYKKGAVVLDMIARTYGEENFLRILEKIVEVADFRSISTEDFVALAERVSGTDLGPFARQFIYGTGLPEVYYDYELTEGEGGGWVVTGRARQQSPYHYRYRIVERPGGWLDVVGRAVEQTVIEDSRLVVPVQIEVYDPEKVEGGRKARREAEEKGNSTLQGHTLLTGGLTEFRFEIPLRPIEVSFDPDHEVFGRFFDERRHPKRMAYYRGLDLAASGESAAAREALSEALASAVVGEAVTAGDDRGEDDVEQEGRLLDVRIHARFARLSLDEGQASEAAEHAERARGLLRRKDPSWLEEDVRVVEARVALAGGDARGAYDLLRKKVLRDRVVDTEGLAVLAIAASQVGDREELEQASEAALAAGVDLGVLEEE